MTDAAKPKMLAHERALVASGELADVTHARASSTWLHAASSDERDGIALVYRPMGDAECLHLVARGALPATQPYQAIIEGERGRVYAEKYLGGLKKVDTRPT